MKHLEGFKSNQTGFLSERFVVLQHNKHKEMSDEDVTRRQVTLLPDTDEYILMNENWTSDSKNGRISSPLDARLRRLRANDRERRRIQSINGAMEALRRVVPDTKNNRKVTKLQLLKLAQDYIKYLSDVLRTSDCSTIQTSGYRITTQMNIEPFDCYQPSTCDSFATNYFSH